MRYSDELVEEVRTRSNIVDVVSQYVKLQRRGSNYFGLCPFHNEKSPSFSVSPGKQIYYCFGCGAGGSVITFLMQYENYTFQEAMKTLADRAGIQLPEIEYSREAKAEADRKAVLLEINKKAARFYYAQLRSPQGEQGMHYLKGRGLSSEIMQKFGLGYAGKYNTSLYQYLKKEGYNDELLKESGLFSMDERRGVSDKFWNRVMFPIMDANSRVIGFGGRVMGDGKPKYLNSPETRIFDKSRNLYGLNIARSSRKKNLIICEGYMDVISMHQAGFNNAVASLGTALTSQQASLLKRYTDDVLIIYDMDGAGVRAALRAIPMLRTAGLRTKVVDLKPHKDPDEFIQALGREAFEERLEKAENSFLFEIRMLYEEYDMSDPQGKTDFFHKTAERLLRFEDEIERNSYVESVSRIYGISQEMLQQQIRKLAMKGTAVSYQEQREDRTSKRKREKVSGADQAQKLMLTWISNYPGILSQLKPYLKPEHFSNPLYREVAELLFSQLEKGEISPARIIDHFEDGETQTEVAGVFHARLELENPEAMQKALRDVVCSLRESSINTRIAEMPVNDLAGLQKLVQEKKELEQLRFQFPVIEINT
ncbi:MAG: DNA primase [Lachnospiraceae bacterium]|nr:DNA primase [Lachnospiraceae bacterium]